MNVVQFTGARYDAEEVDPFLDKQKGQLEKALVIGMNKDGSFHFAGSFSEIPDILFLLKLAEKFIMEASDE